jgi:hypothetical protein
MQFKQYLLIALVLIAANTANAQAVSQLDYEGRQNYGLKMGMGINSMYGGKLQNPRPTIGFMAGLYIHSNPEKKRSPFGLQSGIDLRMRGSNFANGKTGDTAINRAFNTYNSIKEWDRLPIKLYDLQAVAGYQYRGETLGYSVSMKMGLLNLNDNFVIRGMVDTDNDGIEDKEIELISPTTDPLKEKPGTRQMIGTWSLEFALVF